MATRFDDLTKGQCAADGCARGIRSRGLCGMHYQRQHDHGSLDKPVAVGWCKGLTAATDERIRLGAARMAISKRGSVPWNKGLTKADPRIAAAEDARRQSREYVTLYSKAERNRRWRERRKERDPLGLIDSEKSSRQQVRARGGYTEVIDYRLIIERDGWNCGICGGAVVADDLSFDHIVAIGLGGEHIADNVQVSHAACNSRKGSEVRWPAKAVLPLV